MTVVEDPATNVERDQLVSEYLAVSGAMPICIVRVDDGFGFVLGRAAVAASNVATIYWVDAKLARRIVRQARREAWHYADVATAERELHHAAAAHLARLTPNLVAISRATFAARKLQAHLEQLRVTGGLADFNQAYKRQRTAANLRGEGFMSFGAAMLRLRRVMIGLLINKQPFEPETVFNQVFSSHI